MPESKDIPGLLRIFGEFVHLKKYVDADNFRLGRHVSSMFLMSSNLVAGFCDFEIFWKANFAAVCLRNLVNDVNVGSKVLSH